ncbi:3-isopropylmalate dehydrogenase A [Penicillium longicatenatum]|nr:3-isopropylmalate dehydrogenase A [Penicillium longicatenatum]
MPAFNVVVFGGDHCGPDVTAEAVKILRVIEKSRDVTFNLQDHLLGGASIDATGTPLTDEALNAAKNADAVLLGAIGGPKWGTGAVRPEQGILRLRKEMGTFGNLRPCNFAAPSLVESSPSTQPPLPVTSLDKANVLATSRLWRKVVTEVMANEFPQVPISHQLIDSAAMIMIKNPRQLNGIVVTSNLFGDIISDEASVIPGSLGLLPSASLTAVPDGKTKVNGIYEPIHGSAPDIAGKGIVNPVAAILSVAMMLQYSFGMFDDAKIIEKAVSNVIEAGVRTGDIGGKATTTEVGDAVAAELAKLLQ